jgi:hypothetical protein
MIESYTQAIEEFKRVEHLYHVSLKYTRTADVIRSVIERLISTFEYSIDSILKCFKEENMIESIPANPIGKANLITEKIIDEQTKKHITMYLKLRKIIKAEYTKRDEFRRHVTMTVKVDEETLNIDIDKLKEYYEETKGFLSFAKSKVQIYRSEVESKD